MPTRRKAISGTYPVPRTRAEYREALHRAAALRAAGKTAEASEELAMIESAIAQYVAVPEQPARRKGRPNDDQNGM